MHKMDTKEGDDVSMLSDSEDENTKAESYKNKGNDHFKGKHKHSELKINLICSE